MHLRSKTETEQSAWFYIQKPNPDAKIRLFCFPYAGGGTYIFRNWHLSLPEEIEIVSIRAPGREQRFSEQPISSLGELVKNLHLQILSLTDKPFIFFGHSNGALTCFELARSLQRGQYATPDIVVLSAKCPPHRSKDEENISELPDQEFLEKLRELNGTPPQVLQSPELMELFMPLLRADFSLGEKIKYQDDIKLACPTTIFYGEQDKITTEEVLAWQDLLKLPIEKRAFSGGHFFIDQQRDELLAALNQVIKSYLFRTLGKSLIRTSK